MSSRRLSPWLCSCIILLAVIISMNGLTISALPTEFIINIATVPEFKDLKIFNGDEKLATSVKAGFDEHIWDKIKPDMKEALKYKYARHIKKQINFLN
uniref:Lipocalin n=1 Tax=Rhipicephalus zambeziensis TaxID=60191 RepID=A0A224YJK6_9ACAR